MLKYGKSKRIKKVPRRTKGNDAKTAKASAGPAKSRSTVRKAIR